MMGRPVRTREAESVSSDAVRGLLSARAVRASSLDAGWRAGADGSGQAPLRGHWRAGGVVRHAFTHFELELSVALYDGHAAEDLAGGEWWPVSDIEQAGLPTLFAKAARLALASR